METRPLVPWSVRHRAALRRVIRPYTEMQDREMAAAYFARCVEDLRRMGLEGTGLIVAAEHMAASRLRHRRDSQPLVAQLAG